MKRKPLKGIEAAYDQAERTTYAAGVRDGMMMALRMARGETQHGVRGFQGPVPAEMAEWMGGVLKRLMREEDGDAVGRPSAPGA